MKKKFLTAYDYSTGAIWQYIWAENKKQIQIQYPNLTVLEEYPEWWESRDMGELKEYDIENLPKSLLELVVK